jgi:hypothetical protein
VTHPFHPLRDREWEVVTRRHNWREEQVYYHDEEGQLVALPLAWTNLAEVDLVVVMGGGRAAFRVVDLLALANLVGGIRR